jgi:hypothetical protein
VIDFKPAHRSGNARKPIGLPVGSSKTVDALSAWAEKDLLRAQQVYDRQAGVLTLG